MSRKLVFLGCRAPSPSINGFTSIALVYDGDVILIDAGEGTQRSLSRAGISLARISTIVISHLHGDHVLGLIPLMESRSLLGIQRDLIVYGPPGIKEFIEENLEMLNFSPTYKYNIVEGINLEINHSKYAINSFPVRHSITTLGFKIRLGNYLIVYTADTVPCDDVITNSANANILIHDSTYSYIDMDKAYKHMHSTSVDAAIAASKANVGMLVLTHISQRYSDLSRLLYEAKSKFFNTLVAEELMHLPL